MLDQATRQLVKGTAPVLQQHGVALTRHFYARMFQHNPELKEIFNQGHQHNGSQQQALAMAVAAYAEHIDDPSVLLPVLERVAAKHVSLGIRKEHYAIVGKHLLASISEVLGEAASAELLAAWAAAYQQLADILVTMEQGLYDKAATSAGGWTGWRSFRVQRKRFESAEITSFYLAPADGGSVPEFHPGQYISVRAAIPALGYRQARQYSLSAAPGEAFFRISVKREAGSDDTPEGMISNYLHQQVEVGDLLEIAPPAGDFFLHDDRKTPVVLISAGVGITPMMSMLEHLARSAQKRSVRFFHASRHAGVEAFAGRVSELIAALPDAQSWIVHQDKHPDYPADHHDALGHLDLHAASKVTPLPADADYYLCGPVGFMQQQVKALQQLGVANKRIHHEVFATGGLMQ
ncbi:NO-inducible flavohemoprotein [Chitinilyticum piscinae]|uniref:Flavohemoprotein n=1 Tax=Chitinilyticum piscinae TaxID=2866724 RepID=A0A8J7FPQ0_9NEIS|nr:NO-inducible flavohemoprotein [Chitinilyticum piscinae]MBE9610921.1 NO-inducible flavohemoprotein [Chitinilyticum piscinae]